MYNIYVYKILMPYIFYKGFIFGEQKESILLHSRKWTFAEIIDNMEVVDIIEHPNQEKYE